MRCCNNQPLAMYGDCNGIVRFAFQFFFVVLLLETETLVRLAGFQKLGAPLMPFMISSS